MRKLMAGLAGLAVAALPGVATMAPATAAPPTGAAAASPDGRGTGDALTSPLQAKQQAERARAQEMVLTGEATPKGSNKVVKIAPGQYVELAREDEDSIFTVLGEFADLG